MKKLIYIIYIALGVGLFINAAFGAFAPVSSPAIGTGAASNTILITNGTSSIWVATSSLGLGGAGVTISGGVLAAIIDSNSTTTVVGQTTTNNTSPLRVVTQSKYAYVVTQTGSGSNFETWDVSTNTPAFVSNLNTGFSNSTGLTVKSNYAYVIAPSGIKVVDITNPKTPYVLSTVNSPNAVSFYQGFIYGHYLYVATLNVSQNVYIYDIANPSRPVFVSTLDSAVSGAKIQDVFVSGNFAYDVDAANNNLYTWDVSNPLKPVKISTYSTTLTTPVAIYVSNSLAYIGASNGLEIVDVSSKTTPVLIATYGAGSLFDLDLDGRYLYASQDAASAIQIFDIATSTNPTPVIPVTTDAAPKGLTVDGRFIYVVTYTNSKLQKIDLKGIETTSAIIHSLHAGTINTTEDINTRSLFANGTILSGIGGLSTLGSLAVSSTNTPSIILGGLYIGTTSPATTSPNYGVFQSSTVVIEATSSRSTPLTLRGNDSQLSNLFQVQNSANANLFFINNNGGFLASASSTLVGDIHFMGNINASSTATSTHANGIKLYAGCFQLPDGTCAGSSSGTLTGTGANNELAFWTGATSLSIDSQLWVLTSSANQLGSIGIGSSTPAARLAILGGSGSTTPLVDVASSTGQSAFKIWSSGTTTVDQLQTGTLTFPTNFGIGTLIDMSVTSAAANNTVEAYDLSLNASSTLRIWGQSDGSGNIKNTKVGVGSTTPWGTLSVETGFGNPGFVVGNNGQPNAYFIVANNNVGIGTSSPGQLLSVAGTTLISGTTTVNGLISTSTAILASVSGNVLVGTSTDNTSAKLAVNGSVSAILTAFATGDSAVCQQTPGGLITVDSGVSSCIVSSKRFKHDIVPLSLGLSDLMQLQPVTFKANGNNSEHMGFIAEQVASIPSLSQLLVVYEPDKVTPKSFRYDEAVALLVKSIQEQQSEINELKAEVKQLQNAK